MRTQARKSDARRDVVVVVALALALALALARARASSAVEMWTQDGRACAKSFDIGGGVVARGCVRYKESGVLWCKGEDGYWGACASDDSEDPRAAAEYARRRADVGNALAGLGSAPNGSAPAPSSSSAPSLPLSPAPPSSPSLPYSPSSPSLFVEQWTAERCESRLSVRWESPQADGSSEFGLDIYTVLKSGRDILDGWNILIQFVSSDVAIDVKSAYGADVRTVATPNGKMYQLRDRGYDASLSLYSTKRIGFNARTREGTRGLALSYVKMNGDQCSIILS